MKDVIRAINQKLRSNSDLTTQVGTIAYGSVDKNKKLPWLVFSVSNEVPSYAFCDANTFYTIPVDINIYMEKGSVATILSIMDTVDDTMNNASITYSDSTHISCLRNFEVGPMLNSDCWTGYLQYNVMYQPN
jgi:hypothetical protein